MGAAALIIACFYWQDYKPELPDDSNFGILIFAHGFYMEIWKLWPQRSWFSVECKCCSTTPKLKVGFSPSSFSFFFFFSFYTFLNLLLLNNTFSILGKKKKGSFHDSTLAYMLVESCLDTHELLGCVLEACDLAEEHWVLGNVPHCPNAWFLRSQGEVQHQPWFFHFFSERGRL